jgi:hypothetical protein
MASAIINWNSSIYQAQLHRAVTHDTLSLAFQDLENEYITREPVFSYANGFWPRSGFMGDSTVDLSTLESIWFEQPDKTRGVNSRVGFQGVTRDVYNSPLGGVACKLFRTSDDAKIDQIVSDPSGNYLLSSPYYPDAHFIVTYKAGSTDVFGTSVNTLIGA